MLETFGLTVMRGTRASAEWMVRKHYLRKWPAVVREILLLCSHGEPMGVIVFALPPRETAVRYGCECWELARLWCDDKLPRNTESWLIARAVKFVRKEYPSVGCLVSYADPDAGHEGTIYRAANWIPDGQTDDERKTPRFYRATVKHDLLGERVEPKARGARDASDVIIRRSRKPRFIYRFHKRPPAMRGRHDTMA